MNKITIYYLILTAFASLNIYPIENNTNENCEPEKNSIENEKNRKMLIAAHKEREERKNKGKSNIIPVPKDRREEQEQLNAAIQASNLNTASNLNPIVKSIQNQINKIKNNKMIYLKMIIGRVLEVYIVYKLLNNNFIRTKFPKFSQYSKYLVALTIFLNLLPPPH